MNKKGDFVFVNRYLFIVVLMTILFELYLVGFTQANLFQMSATQTVENATSTAWTNGTAGKNQTFGSIFSKTSSDWNFKFFVNYTNITGVAVNITHGNGLCRIQFNQTISFDGFVNMSYNSTLLLWEYNRSFNYKGNLSFQTNCSSTYGNITLTDYFIVENTKPRINWSDEGSGLMASVSCTEDNVSSCTYNLTVAPYVIEDDYNDRASLLFTITSNTNLTNYSISSGILIVNKTVMNQSATQNLYFSVSDSSGVGEGSANLPISITAVNDAPYFTNLQNQSFNMSSVFNYNVSAADEENNINFTFNISFVSCSVASWSTRNCSTTAGRELFNSSYWSTLNSTALNISFTPTKNDVGSYIVNFTVTDLNNDLSPKNASTSYTVNFTILNINSMPYFGYVCDNERNTTENSVFSCYINASDIDEINNLTVSANYSWFKFNSSTNTMTLTINASISLNASALVNFTATDSEVGNWSVNISVSDSNSPAGINSTVISFFVDNVNDSVSLINLINGSAIVDVPKTIYINASDDDLLIPDKRVYNETLTLTTNVSWITVTSQEITGNVTVFSLSISASSSVVGNNSINLTVRDANNYSLDSKLIVITVTASSGSTPVTTSSGGGSGGTTTVIKPASLKLLLPEPIIVNKSGSVVLPITLQNNGQVNLTNISLSGSIGKNGTLIKNIKYYFTQDFFTVLIPGEKRSTNLVVEINITENGIYEFSVNASAKSPSYTDYGKVYINVKEGQVTESKIIFAEQLIVSNEVCSNIQSLLDEAKTLYDNKNFKGAEDKLDKAISDCKQAIDQVQAQQGNKPPSKNVRMFAYIILAVILALGAGVAYYVYQQMKLKKILDENDF